MRSMLSASLLVVVVGCTYPQVPQDRCGSFDLLASGAYDPDGAEAEIAAAVPGYGGRFFRDGVMHAWMVEPTDEKARKLEEVLRLRAGTLVLLEGKYDWRELLQFRDRLYGEPQMPLWSSFDVNEGTNRITIGYATAENYDPECGPVTTRAELEAWVVRAGVPLEAVELQETGYNI